MCSNFTDIRKVVKLCCDRSPALIKQYTLNFFTCWRSSSQSEMLKFYTARATFLSVFLFLTHQSKAIMECD